MRMANIDPAEMAAIAEFTFVPRIHADMGAQGTHALKRLLPVIRQIHLAISTERMTKGLEVVCRLQGDEPAMQPPYRNFNNTSALTAYFDGTTALTVQVADDGLRVWFKALDVIPDSEFIGYRYDRPHSENFFNTEKTYEIPVVAAFPSFLGIPYFRQLRESLEEYGITWIKNSACEIFDQSWFDNKRTAFSPRPEILMRRSLQRHLRSGLREYTALNVMPEQNVNETRPVDIKVTWGTHNRVALIEIKWLGKSINPDTMAITQNFTASRAREGARQVADYLDLYHSQAPFEEVRGYLIVFDARRRSVTVPIVEITPANAMHYRYEEIEYDGSILDRADFEHPVRYFCEPVLIIPAL